MMKYIITEEQFDRLATKTAQFWVRRRVELVKSAMMETYERMEFEICRINNYERFEKEFFHDMMDNLHPYFYDDESFVYNDVFEVLRDLFYVECTEFYFEGREKC